MPGEEKVQVVLVDDEPDMLMMMRLHLGRDARFEIVAEAGDGREGLDRCAELQPDIVVLDVKMPGMDGMTAMPLIRAASPATKVVLFTAFSDLVDVEEVRSNDAELLEKSAPLPWLIERLFTLART
ncbi:MAG: hypothetical protein QOE35_2415 [Actinomycetota bacterium]|jgi:DNA-binding NarL/FixJ family response regulator